MHSAIEYQMSHARHLAGLDHDQNDPSPYRASWWGQFRAVLWRSFLSMVKEPLLIRVRVIQTLV